MAYLASLHKIIQAMQMAPDLQGALDAIVEQVVELLQTQAASIFLIDNARSEYVLVSSVGLNKNIIGKLRVPLDKGLIGLVGRREEPLNVEEAQKHPQFFYHPDVGEDNYQAFLGVPIIHHRRLFGVLVVHQEDARRFDKHEEAFLVTLAAQFASRIAQAHTSGELRNLSAFKKEGAREENIIVGIPSVPGVGIGQALVVYPHADLNAIPEKEVDDPQKEIQAIDDALQAVVQDIRRISERLSQHLPEAEQALFDVYLQILTSETLRNEILSQIDAGQWAQSALKKVIQKHVHYFESVEDPYLRERASDFRDLGRRILAHLQKNIEKQVIYTEKTILIGEEIPASSLADVPKGKLAGLVSLSGSSSSHVAILARALGIPTVMGAEGISLSKLTDTLMIVDGYFGQVFIDPNPACLQEYEKLAKEEKELEESLEGLRDLPSETPDEYRVNLLVNTGLAGDATLALSVGAEGVGLFRTEIPFMVREQFPVEEEQYILYKQLLKTFFPRPVSMRTLDIGGDKTLSYFPIVEANPFLGWRGIRVTLDHPDVFLIQLRAMLKAHAETGNLKILLPMVSGVGECDEALRLINQAYSEILEEGYKTEKPPIGVMVEIPSAVYQARALAKRVDFISVGSNDLTQYILAVDRNNAQVAGLYDSLHPAVLSALIQVIEGAHAEGKPVSICGEMTSDPISVIILMAMGFDSISLNSTSLLRVKWVIRNMTMARARKLLGEVLQMESPALIRFHLEKAVEEIGLGGLIRAGKS